MARGKDQQAAKAPRRAVAQSPARSQVLVDTDELLGLLVALGLTQNESRVYLVLLSSSGLTAAEAAARAGVPRPKVYEALGALEGRGFCRSVGERTRRFTAVEPDTALRNWLRHRDHERAAMAERDQTHVETLTRLLPRPAVEPVVGVPDFIEGISGRLPTTEALENVMSSARSTLFEMLQPPFLQPRPRWNVMEAEAVARGVDVRVIYTPEAIADPARYRALAEAGGKVRITDTLPMKLLIRDGEEALISLRDAHSRAQSVTSARIRHPDLVAPLLTLFMRVWREAGPIER
jgi:sugar-specific transcriptional regulator TrmB